ncbi:F-box protein SKIP22-like [Corylus avellana]|uniref:F-box protein SKIP22-like n=1 Tax=Corylus avellana TaxID=13451 RepID=UPI001E2295DC|nr:F-box protein SKIP22-like [Corylus avellana]
MSDSKPFQEQDASVVLNSENEGTLEFSGAETMRVDDGSVSMVKKFFERHFPRVLGDYGGLVGLCEKTGLGPPPCFMRLPAELQRKILESLHGVDLAKVGCVCSELRDLSSDNELWKQKFIEEFGGGAAAASEIVEWKAKFASFWKNSMWNNSFWKALELFQGDDDFNAMLIGMILIDGLI